MCLFICTNDQNVAIKSQIVTKQWNTVLIITFDAFKIWTVFHNLKSAYYWMLHRCIVGFRFNIGCYCWHSLGFSRSTVWGTVVLFLLLHFHLIRFQAIFSSPEHYMFTFLFPKSLVSDSTAKLVLFSTEV